MALWINSSRKKAGYGPIAASPDSPNPPTEYLHRPIDPRCSSTGWRASLILGLVTLPSITINILFAFYLIFQHDRIDPTAPSGWTGIDQVSVWKKHVWTTPYSSSNRTISDALWHDLHPAFGTVALPLNWAAEQRLPETEPHPTDPTKGLYILDSYHQIHCIIMIRTALLEFADGKSQTFPLAHPTHCLDALRQAVMCRADDTPLYSFGDLTSGDGQWRQCRDWNRLSRWAAERFVAGPHDPEVYID